MTKIDNPMAVVEPGTTLESFICRFSLSMTSRRTDSNPNVDNERWEADHWRVNIRLPEKAGKDSKRFSIVFSMGKGHKGRHPALRDVLDCLRSDALSIESTRNFKDWATELGFDPDSRKAERSYRATKGQTELLKEFLGEEAYQVLLYDMED